MILFSNCEIIIFIHKMQLAYFGVQVSRRLSTSGLDMIMNVFLQVKVTWTYYRFYVMLHFEPKNSGQNHTNGSKFFIVW